MEKALTPTTDFFFQNNLYCQCILFCDEYKIVSSIAIYY